MRHDRIPPLGASRLVQSAEQGEMDVQKKTATAIAALPGFLLIAVLVIGFFVPGTVSQFDREAGLTSIGRAHHLLAVISIAAIAVHAVYLAPVRLKRLRRRAIGPTRKDCSSHQLSNDWRGK